MSLSSCLWPPMKLKFKSTEGTLSGKNRSVWNQSTVEWRKIICSSLGYWTFLLSIVNVYRTGFHKEFPIFKNHPLFMVLCHIGTLSCTGILYIDHISSHASDPPSPISPPVPLLISCHIHQRIRVFQWSLNTWEGINIFPMGIVQL